MRRFFCLLLLIVLPVVASGQKRSGWRKADDGYWDRKNLIGVGMAAISFNGNSAQGIVPLTMSYDRTLKYNMTVGGLIHSANHFFDTVDDGYVVKDQFMFAGLRAGYNLRVGRNVYLRFGLGAGLGFHHINDIDYGCVGMEPGTCGDGIPHYPASRLLPHLLVDIHWVFRVGRNLEMMFAPLFLSPSQLIFSPWRGDYYNGYYNVNLAPVRLCVRF